MHKNRRWMRRRWRRGMYLLARQLLRTTGFRGTRPIGRWLADVEFLVSRKVRNDCSRDLAQLLGRRPGDPVVRDTLRQSYRTTVVAIVEALAMFDRRQDNAVLDARCELDGIENLRSALTRGRGAVLLASHLGNCALVAVELAYAGWPISVVYRQAQMMSEGLFKHGLRLYGIEGIRANDGIQAYGQMLSALRSGRIVYVAMDQGTKTIADGIMVRFLGKDLPMPAGPAQLARHAGAPLLPLWTTAAEPVWKFVIDEAVRYPPGSSLESEVQHLVRLTEEHILQYPGLWSWHHRRWRRYPMAAHATCAQ